MSATQSSIGSLFPEPASATQPCEKPGRPGHVHQMGERRRKCWPDMPKLHLDAPLRMSHYFMMRLLLRNAISGHHEVPEILQALAREVWASHPEWIVLEVGQGVTNKGKLLATLKPAGEAASFHWMQGKPYKLFPESTRWDALLRNYHKFQRTETEWDDMSMRAFQEMVREPENEVLRQYWAPNKK